MRTDVFYPELSVRDDWECEEIGPRTRIEQPSEPIEIQKVGMLMVIDRLAGEAAARLTGRGREAITSARLAAALPHCDWYRQS